MFRMWCKIWKDARLVKHMTVSDSSELNRTKKIFEAIDRLCGEWDLARPIWLDANVREFKKHSKTRFGQDCFAETIDFDYLEIQVIEEDY